MRGHPGSQVPSLWLLWFSLVAASSIITFCTWPMTVSHHGPARGMGRGETQAERGTCHFHLHPLDRMWLYLLAGEAKKQGLPSGKPCAQLKIKGILTRLKGGTDTRSHLESLPSWLSEKIPEPLLWEEELRSRKVGRSQLWGKAGCNCS